MHDWVFGCEDWQSLAMYNSQGQHNYSNIPNDIVISLPRKFIKQGTVEVVNDLSLDDDIS